jgi:ADP-ribose pyrophosphatase YjhB (NUDIX family)
MYKVFVENRPVIFTQTSENYSHSLCVAADEVEDITVFVRNHAKTITQTEPLVLQCFESEVEFNRLFRHHERAIAAGGIVIREDEILFIRKNDMWDLPKGFVDSGETTAQTAYREIWEECGIKGHELVSKLSETWHTYTYHNRLVLKQSHWFEFHYSGTKNTFPQVDEGISEAIWMPKNQIYTVLEECYGSIRDLLDYFLQKAEN